MKLIKSLLVLSALYIMTGCAAMPAQPVIVNGVAATQPSSPVANDVLSKIETVVNQAEGVLNTVSSVPSPVQGYAAMVAAILAGGLATERLIRTYIVKPAVKLPDATAVVQAAPTVSPQPVPTVATLIQQQPPKAATGAS
jgi:hypothetical protein